MTEFCYGNYPCNNQEFVLLLAVVLLRLVDHAEVRQTARDARDHVESFTAAFFWLVVPPVLLWGRS